VEPAASGTLPRDLRPVSVVHGASSSAEDSSSEVARLRRDIKNTLEQQNVAVACGDVPLVTVPLLGRCIRIFGDWYSICTQCGAMCRVTPASRFGTEICCTRCDFSMSNGKEMEAALMEFVPRKRPLTCRFCSKMESGGGHGGGTSKWRTVAAPLDLSPPNVDLPPSLRTVSYCPSHFRPWVVAAHLEIDSTVIMAHIGSRCRPMFGAEVGKRLSISVEAETATKPKRRPRNTNKLKAKVNSTIRKNTRVTS